jgi:NAD(P)-dependent dehydrogenase (short-subunit alcohol dehydrogenase family)
MSEQVLITGANGLIGRALVEQYLGAGYRVIAQVRDTNSLLKRDNLEIVAIDFAKDSAAQLISNIKQLDILINNAANQEVLPIANLSRSKIEEVLKVNVIAPFELSVAAKAAGATRIINISSVEADVAKSGHEIYGASKAALESLTKTLANALAPTRVNGVRLGLIGDSELPKRWSAGVTSWNSAVAASRYATPEEVANFVMQISGKDFSYTTGAIFDFDGGKSASAGW